MSPVCYTSRSQLCIPDPKRKGWQLCIYNLDKTRTRRLGTLLLKTCHLSATLPDYSYAFQTQSVMAGNFASVIWIWLEPYVYFSVIIAQNVSSFCYTPRPWLCVPDIQWNTHCAQPYSRAKLSVAHIRPGMTNHNILHSAWPFLLL